MSVTSDAQQSRDAHLKQAFEKHLPRRIASIQRRTLAMCAGGWDINTLHLIYSEVQQLAGSAGNYGLVDASEKLFALEVYLSSFTESGLVPDADQTTEVERLTTDLDELSGGGSRSGESEVARRRASATVVSSVDLPEPIIEMNGLPAVANIPTMVIPPLDFLPFDELPVSPLGDVEDEQDRFDLDTDADSANENEFENFEDDGEISIGDIADQLIRDERQLDVGEDGEFESAWKDAGMDEPIGNPRVQSADSIALLDDDEEADNRAGGDDGGIDLELDDDEIDSLIQSVPDSAAETIPDKPAPRKASSANKTITLSKAKTVYFLRRPDPLTDSLVSRLEPEYEVHSFDDVEEFREILGALGPEVVMVDGSFIDAVEDLGPLIKKIRSKQSGPMPMLAFSDRNDVATRLKILRAGADAFFPTDAPAEKVRARLAELLQARSEDPYRVLILEDDRSQAMFAQSILKKAGMEVHLERNPLKIMEALEAFHPDLILMDLYMPDCDGIELTAIVRERDEFVNTPIVFLSGEEDTDKHFDALLAGGDDFLAKPIRPKHLIQAVTNRVQRARMVRRRGGGAPGSDSVTGLIDRQTLLERINSLLADFDRMDPELPGGVLYAELDQPLDLRRDLGLSGFEQLTAQLAPLLTEDLSRGELAGRYGDNAYVLLIPSRSREALEVLARDLVRRIKKHYFKIDEQTCTASVSVGVCPLSSQLADAGAVISAAERVCNRTSDATETGRIHVVSTDQAVSPEQSDDEELSPLIDDALEKRRFQVLFQPIVSLQGDHSEQYQTLLRLPGSDGRPVPAARFIPVAERNDQICKIDRWIVSRALSVIDDSGRRGRTVRLFVNQSGATVEHKENLPWLGKLIETRNVNPSLLVLEFKLPEIVTRLKTAVAYAKELTESNLQVALGSFDGSDAAFQVLEHFPAKFVKLPAAGGNRELPSRNIKEIVRRLHDLDKLVIIPSIEDAKTAASLWPTGVDFIQGNFVQAPGEDLGYQF